MEDMYCDSDDNDVMSFTVINPFYTCQVDVEDQDDGWYVSVYDAAWRNVHSRNFYMSLL